MATIERLYAWLLRLFGRRRMPRAGVSADVERERFMQRRRQIERRLERIELEAAVLGRRPPRKSGPKGEHGW